MPEEILEIIFKKKNLREILTKKIGKNRRRSEEIPVFWEKSDLEELLKKSVYKILKNNR